MIVLSEDGICRAYRRATGAPPPPEEPAPEEPPPEEPDEEDVPPSARVHSPLGFTFLVPDGWVVSENATRGIVSLGLRPDPDAEVFGLEGADDLTRLTFELSGRFAVILSPLSRASLNDLAKRFLEIFLK